MSNQFYWNYDHNGLKGFKMVFALVSFGTTMYWILHLSSKKGPDVLNTMFCYSCYLSETLGLWVHPVPCQDNLHVDLLANMYEVAGLEEIFDIHRENVREWSSFTHIFSVDLEKSVVMVHTVVVLGERESKNKEDKF